MLILRFSVNKGSCPPSHDCPSAVRKVLTEVAPKWVSVPRETGVIGRTLVLRLPEQEPKGIT